jgi:hypothetical protein
MTTLLNILYLKKMTAQTVNKEGGECRLDSSGSGQDLMAVCCGHTNELSGSIKHSNLLPNRAIISFLKGLYSVELIR